MTTQWVFVSMSFWIGVAVGYALARRRK